MTGTAAFDRITFEPGNSRRRKAGLSRLVCAPGLAGGGRPAKVKTSRDRNTMRGRACLRRMRITVSTIVGLVAEGETAAEIIGAYPDLEPEDVRHTLAYAAWLTREEVMPA